MHEMSLWLGRRLPGGADAAIGMNKGGTFEADGIKVTMTHADHSAGDWNPGGETTLYLGDPVGFVVELENGFRFYFAGDTTPFGDMALIRELYAPSLAFLPIGGHYTMDPRGAALAAELLGVEDVVPIHYGTFPILTGTPEQLRAELDGRGLQGVAIHAPEPGGIRRLMANRRERRAQRRTASTRTTNTRRQTRYQVMVLIAVVGLDPARGRAAPAS